MRNRLNTPRAMVGPRLAGSRIITVKIVIKFPFYLQNKKEHELHLFSNPSLQWNPRGDSDETDVTEEIPEHTEVPQDRRKESVMS